MMKSSCAILGDVAPPEVGARDTPPSQSASARVQRVAAEPAVAHRYKGHADFELRPLLRSECQQAEGSACVASGRKVQRAYDSACLSALPATLGGDAASRAQAVAPITTAPITAKTCRQSSDVMVRPAKPNVV